MLYQQSDAFDIFIADSASIMFAKTNGSTVRLIPCCFRYIYCRFFQNNVCKDKWIVCWINTLMLVIHLLNNFPQQCLLRELDRLLEKHAYAINAFIVGFSSIMFAKTNGSTVRWIPCCFRYIYCRFFQNMVAKTNWSTVGEAPLCYWRIYCIFFLNYVC